MLMKLTPDIGKARRKLRQREQIVPMMSRSKRLKTKPEIKFVNHFKCNDSKLCFSSFTIIAVKLECLCVMYVEVVTTMK